jgi:cation diffusion facilitator CzcD-associated flavoprotein CzcO
MKPVKNNFSDVLIIGAGAAGLAAARDLSVACIGTRKITEP